MTSTIKQGDKVYSDTDKGWAKLVDGNRVKIDWDKGEISEYKINDFKVSTLGHFNLIEK